MTAFLSWLYSVASKIYQWFGSAYSTLYNGALNAWNWAVSLAQNAYNAATNFIISIRNSLLETLTTYVNWLSQKIDELRQGVIDDITSALDWVTWKLSQIDALVQQSISNAIGDISNLWVDVTNTVSSLIVSASSWLQSWVLDIFGWMLSIRDRILALIATLTPENIGALFTMLAQWKAKALLFFANPLVFILDLIQPYIIDFMSYVLGWALGTTKYDLPTTQRWKDR